jgi:predicted transcriptional regulator
MDIVFILKTLAGLIVILALLVLLFVYPAKKREIKKAAKKKQPKKSTTECNLKDIIVLLKNKQTEQKELEEAIACMVKYHAKIPNKLGIRAHPDFDMYEEIILRLCNHPSTNKDIILKLDRALQKQNPTYTHELNNALSKGLNARGM